MRIEIAGAQITDAVVEVLDTLQNQTELMENPGSDDPLDQVELTP